MRLFGALGRTAHRRRYWVVGVWLVVLLGGAVVGTGLFDRLETVDSLTEGAESARADRQLQQVLSDGPVIFAVISDVDVYSPALVASVGAAVADLRARPDVVEVTSLYTSPAGPVGADNRSSMVTVELAENLTESAQEAAEDAVAARLHAIDTPSVLVGGDHLAERAFGEQAGRDLAVGETVAFVLLIVALVVVFGGFLAATLPLAVAVVGVSATFLVLAGIATVATVGEYSINIVTLLGIGLAVDYSLVIVARFREQRLAGDDIGLAIETAMTHAGRAVAISGVAVAVALAGLTAFAEPLLASMALGGAVSVLVTTALALTAIPALLAIAGDRIPPAGVRSRAVAAVYARWDHLVVSRLPAARRGRPALLVRLAGLAQRRPEAVAILATLGLLVLALPLAGASFANSDARALPTSTQERRAYDAYVALFSQHQASPVTIVAEVDATSVELRDYLNQLEASPQLLALTLRTDAPAGSVVIDLIPKGASAGSESRDLVRAVRSARPGFPVLVTGEAAKVVDYQESVLSRLPYAVAVVVVAMLVLLFALTGSVLVPIKALLLNALTFLASLGVLVVIFQWGWGEPILRFQSWGAIDLTTPLLLFVFIFGLSMDYEVFLLARIKEEYDRRPDNNRAVLRGIAASGPVVTAAAVCITIVFLGFAVAGLVPVKEIGVGMAVAVILDVTVVRGLLLPAAMTLLGDLNWWSPRRRTPARVTPAA